MNNPPPCPPTGSPDETWDACVRAGSWTIGLGTIAGAIGTVFLGTETPILVGTGLGMAWSLKRCRSLFREKANKNMELECYLTDEPPPIPPYCVPITEPSPEKDSEPSKTPPSPEKKYEDTPTPTLPPPPPPPPPPILSQEENECPFVPEPTLPDICDSPCQVETETDKNTEKFKSNEPTEAKPPESVVPSNIPTPPTTIDPKYDSGTMPPECNIPIVSIPDKISPATGDKCTCIVPSCRPPIICTCPPPPSDGVCTCTKTVDQHNSTVEASAQKCTNAPNRFTWPPLLTFTQVKTQETCTCPVPPEDDAVCTCSEDP